MKITKRILSIMAAVLILSVSCFSAVVSADENTLTFNDGKTANVGDTIDYTFSVGDCPEPLVGIQMYIYYDPEYLQVSEKYNTELTGSVVINPSHIDDNGNGQVIVTASDIAGMDYTQKKTIIDVDFTVLKGGESNITYYITEMYTSNDAMELVPLSNYTFTQDISVNGTAVSEGETPKLETDDDKFESNQISNFVNNEEGRSDGESTYVPSVEATTEAPTDEQIQETQTDEEGNVVTNPTSLDEQTDAASDSDSQTTAESNTQGEQQTENGGVNVVLIVVIIAGVVVVAAIVLLFVNKKKK